MVEEVNGGDNSKDSKTQTQTKEPSTSMEGWNTTQLSMPNITFMEAQNSQEVVNSQDKLIIVEKSFLDISKQMFETSYTLNLGQLLEIALELKKYLWQKLKLEKTQNLNRTTIDKQVGSLELKVRTIVVAIDNHMVIIQI